MKTLWQNDDFCRDAFGETLPRDLKESVVAQMSRARRQARISEAAKAICLVGAILLFGFLLTTKPNKSKSASIAIAAPQAPAWKVHSVEFKGIVRSQPLGQSLIIRSEPAEIAIVHTRLTPMLEIISDEQMFAMLRGWSVGMIKVNGIADLEILSPQIQ